MPTTETENCVHHWMLSPPTGKFSSGECLKCGEKKEASDHFFCNVPDMHRQSDFRQTHVTKGGKLKDTRFKGRYRGKDGNVYYIAKEHRNGNQAM